MVFIYILKIHIYIKDTKDGFDIDGKHKDTKNKYDPNGPNGFDIDEKHKKTKYKYDPNGSDIGENIEILDIYTILMILILRVFIDVLKINIILRVMI